MNLSEVGGMEDIARSNGENGTISLNENRTGEINIQELQEWIKNQGLSLAEVKALVDKNRPAQELGAEARAKMMGEIGKRFSSAMDRVGPAASRFKEGALKFGKWLGKGVDSGIGYAATGEGHRRIAEATAKGAEAVGRKMDAIDDKYIDAQIAVANRGREMTVAAAGRVNEATKPIQNKAGEIGLAMVAGADKMVGAANATVGAIDRGVSAVGTGLESGVAAGAQAVDTAINTVDSTVRAGAEVARQGAEISLNNAADSIDSGIAWSADKVNSIRRFGGRLKAAFFGQVRALESGINNLAIEIDAEESQRLVDKRIEQAQKAVERVNKINAKSERLAQEFTLRSLNTQMTSQELRVAAGK